MKSIEERIYDEQERIIKRDYGCRAAAEANYGWGVDDGARYLTVETKVYKHGVLITVYDRRLRIMDHGFQPN